jgi:hypothetical protein
MDVEDALHVIQDLVVRFEIDPDELMTLLNMVLGVGNDELNDNN